MTAKETVSDVLAEMRAFPESAGIRALQTWADRIESALQQKSDTPMTTGEMCQMVEQVESWGVSDNAEPFAYVDCEGSKTTSCAQLVFPRNVRKGPRGAKYAWRELPPGLHPLFLHPVQPLAVPSPIDILCPAPPAPVALGLSRLERVLAGASIDNDKSPSEHKAGFIAGIREAICILRLPNNA
jgi:hypothetical protein